MTKIKLCGLRRECDIEYANELLPEYIGFIFAPRSKRYVEPELALELRKKLDSEIISVGVFVDENPELIADMIKEVSSAQFSSTETRIIPILRVYAGLLAVRSKSSRLSL